MAGHPRHKTLADALWSRVDRHGFDECWLWTAAVASHGYGNFSFRGKVWLAHRVAYFLETGRLDLGDRDILHRCDVKRCCNPAHLYLGTQQENNRDAFDRDRLIIFRGENAPRAKLTAADVEAIRTEKSKVRYGNRHYAVVAQRFGIHPTMVHAIWAGKYWKHLD